MFQVQKGDEEECGNVCNEHESVSNDCDTGGGNCGDTGTDDRNGAQSVTSDAE
jgi:hypothetical protein